MEFVADVTNWQLVVESRVRRVRVDLAAMADLPEVRRECVAAGEALAVVDDILGQSPHLLRRLPFWWTGWRVERAWRALHEAEVCVIAGDPRLAARLPSVRARVAPNLAEHDPRRRALDELSPGERVTLAERAIVADAVRAAFDTSDDAHAATRAFRNKLFVAAAVLVILNVVLGVLGAAAPRFMPMCVPRVGAPNQLACASGIGLPAAGDVGLVQVMGAAGAIIATVVLLVRRRPSLSPYVLVGYQALIKVLLGALLAVIGVLALGAGVGEGLIGLRNQAALLVAAVVFGYAQQLGTRLLDNYADRLLNEVRPLPAPRDRPSDPAV